MEFTGERYVPGAVGLEELYIEHMSRYRFVRGLAAGRQVLDVGSGCGYGTYHLAAGGARFALGIDVSPEAVAYSRRNYGHPDLCFAVMDASRLCLRAGFGLVTCFELIEHVEDAEAVLKGVHHVLDDAGVFVVSTPNKATYVAGGEGGKNPFHVREYYREEFRDLLGGTFPAVWILGQEWVEGMALVSHPALVGFGDVVAGRLPRDEAVSLSPLSDNEANSVSSLRSTMESDANSDCSGITTDAGPHPSHSGSTAKSSHSSDRSGSGEAPYFIALCAKQPITDEVVTGLRPAVFYGGAVRYDSLKRAALELEREFDRRGVWAQGLEQENRSKDKTIKSLQRELAQLRNRSDERGRWAERLNGELRQSGALVERLAEENRRLRGTLAARRPTGRSKVAK